MSDSPVNPDMSFEEALKGLEAIVERLSSDSETLDNVIVLYEEGMYYLRHCQQKLAEAETKITLLNEKIGVVFPEVDNG